MGKIGRLSFGEGMTDWAFEQVPWSRLGMIPKKEGHKVFFMCCLLNTLSRAA